MNLYKCRKLGIFAILILLSNFVIAQEVSWTVSGQVFEKGTKRPLQDVTLTVRNIESISSVSDAAGKFTLKFFEAGSYTVLATPLGAETPVSQYVILKADVPLQPITFYVLPPTILPELVVSAERNPNRISKTVIKGEELKQVAGTAGDPLKVLQALPGVAMPSNGSSAPAVRGSGPGENFYYADGIPVGKVFHIAGISVFNADLIDSFNLYSAAFAPYYDNVTGAILDIKLRDPRTDRLGGKVNVSLIGADFLLEGPVNNDQSFYFAARRSYFDLFVRTIENKGVTLQIPNYSDYQGKYIWNINADNRVTANLTGATDTIRAEISGDADIAKKQPDLIGTLSSKDSSDTQALVWDARLSSTTNNKLIVGHRKNIAENSVGTAASIYVVSNTNFMREQIVLPIKENHELTLASNYSNSEAGLNLDFKNTNCTQFNSGCDLSTSPRVQLIDNFIATFWDAAAQDRWRASPSVTLIGGLRYSKDNYLNQSYTEPRLGLEWEWSEQTLLSAGWGRHNQQPSGQQIAPKFGNTNLTHILADHSVVGVSRKLSVDWSWKAEVYYKKFSGLVVGVSDPAVNYVNGASGAAYGTELLIKKEATENLSGWFSLTLAKSDRRNDLTGESFRFEFDQPINATLIANYKISDEWAVGSKWAYNSGRPYTPILGSSGPYSSADLRPKPDYAAINSGTLPDYHRLDLRIDRHLIYDTWKLNAYFELNNIYRRQNIVGYDYGVNYDKKEAVEGFYLPFSFGVQGEF